MTSAATVDHAAGQVTRKPRFTNLLLAEWTKIRSVRSTLWTLVTFAVLSVGLTALLTWLVVRALGAGRADARSATVITDPVLFILVQTGLAVGQIAICVLGVLVVTSEYSSGTVRATMLAVPRRIPVLIAKCLVLAAVVFVLAEAIAFATFFVGAAIFNGSAFEHGRVGVSLGQHEVTRAVVGAGLYITVLSLFALAIGMLIRHTAGAIATVLGLVLLVFGLTGLLPYSWGAHIHAYMPTVAGQTLMHVHQQPGDLLSAWQGFGVFCAWAALLLVVGGYLLHRRDA